MISNRDTRDNNKVKPTDLPLMEIASFGNHSLEEYENLNGYLATIGKIVIGLPSYRKIQIVIQKVGILLYGS